MQEKIYKLQEALRQISTKAANAMNEDDLDRCGAFEIMEEIEYIADAALTQV